MDFYDFACTLLIDINKLFLFFYGHWLFKTLNEKYLVIINKHNVNTNINYFGHIFSCQEQIDL